MSIEPSTEPTIEQMRKDLLNGGWTPSHGGTIWTSLWGTSYRGPHKAWHVWTGTPMCNPDKNVPFSEEFGR